MFYDGEKVCDFITDTLEELIQVDEMITYQIKDNNNQLIADGRCHRDDIYPIFEAVIPDVNELKHEESEAGLLIITAECNEGDFFFIEQKGE